MEKKGENKGRKVVGGNVLNEMKEIGVEERKKYRENTNQHPAASIPKEREYKQNTAPNNICITNNYNWKAPK